MRELFFFFNDTATTEIYTLSLHDALPICKDYPAKLTFMQRLAAWSRQLHEEGRELVVCGDINIARTDMDVHPRERKPVIGDRKSTRLNSSHANISYAVFCLKKTNNTTTSI